MSLNLRFMMPWLWLVDESNELQTSRAFSSIRGISFLRCASANAPATR